MAEIYKIINKVNNCCYIGSTSKTTEVRWKKHLIALRAGTHHNLFLQRSFNKYKEDSFYAICIESNINNQYKREQEYLDILFKVFIPKKIYNIRRQTNGYKKFRKTTRRRMSRAARKRKPPSIESRLNQIQTWEKKGNYTIYSPKGIKYTFGNIRAFCRKHNLPNTAIGKIIKGELNYHKGWHSAKSKTYAFVSPTGVIYKDIVVLKDFCEIHSINRKCMSAVFLENKKSYKKWTKYKPNN